MDQERLSVACSGPQVAYRDLAPLIHFTFTAEQAHVGRRTAYPEVSCRLISLATDLPTLVYRLAANLTWQDQ